MKTGMRLDEYTKALLEKRNAEVIVEQRNDALNAELTSPPGATSTEEIRLFNEYMEQANLFKIADALPEKKKSLMLKRFFKMKRKQQVVIQARIGEENQQKNGKVSTVGRDFVMLTNLKDRCWLPYTSITSANIPSGIPVFSNSHQYYLYDNDLRKKLLRNFGETVSRRDVLIQQFYEESLFTNLRAWKDTWVKVQTGKETFVGKIKDTIDQHLILHLFNTHHKVLLKEVEVITALRLVSLFALFMDGSFRKQFDQRKIKETVGGKK
ncbi:hypothetical protein J7E71_10235 [Mesobacillus foraminis]|uniref:hypothetical protein n=1 Tax=Mesobacillus foraminis TaxID=279826 RepID=UPI001BE68237|nr:hypothetical protein [Mesobacillus foraminis]MBT2756330.1 hypothetical protein [Mesobacillus foraminis]